ncbi:MAG: DUF975 family protein [Clostridia bacterium]|nr:DUF975 family protein [Clostridia bacterium]
MGYDRAAIKQLAKEKLGSGIFTSNWVKGVLIGFLYSLISSVPFLAFFLEFGFCRAFLDNARKASDEEEMEVGELFSGFNEQPGRNFLIGFVGGILIFLWSCLFVIPGIIKLYSYSMAYYIAIDNPDLKWNECITKSREMMKGYKWKLFVLDLSFIGWYFVGSLVCGIGSLWVYPYNFQARALFYEQIRN